jgi:hypothetical protein
MKNWAISCALEVGDSGGMSFAIATKKMPTRNDDAETTRHLGVDRINVALDFPKRRRRRIDARPPCQAGVWLSQGLCRCGIAFADGGRRNHN